MSEDSDKQGTRRTRAVVDRIEDGGVAVIQYGDDKNNLVDVPAALLPEGAEGGDHLTITVKLERAPRAAAESRIRALQERLEKRTAGE